jgi:hypothetical protein
MPDFQHPDNSDVLKDYLAHLARGIKLRSRAPRILTLEFIDGECPTVIHAENEEKRVRKQEIEIFIAKAIAPLQEIPYCTIIDHLTGDFGEGKPPHPDV